MTTLRYRGPFWTPITPETGSLFHAETHLRPFGITPKLLARDAVLRAEPQLRGNFSAAIHWADAWTSSDPQGIVLGLIRRFEALGGKLYRGDALGLRRAGNSWTLDSEEGTITARDAVIALGSSSDVLASRFGYRFPLAEKRGYHQMYAYPDGERLRLPVGNPSAGWAVVPLAGGLRIGTGIEFTFRDAPPSFVQIEKAEASAQAFVRLGERLTSQPWLGVRPFMPDMLPVIGPAPRHDGLWFAFGHAHHGFTLGPITGRLLAEWITEGAASHDIHALAPSRFST